MDKLIALFGKLNGTGGANAITFTKVPNAADMRLWMNELKTKCARLSTDPTRVVTWLEEVEKPSNRYEDFGCLGSLYDPKYNSLENKIMEALEKIISGEFKRQVDNLREKWLTQKPVNLLTGRLVLKMIHDKNKVAVHDWHRVDYDRVRTIELKNGNLAKFIQEWDYNLLHSSCQFSEIYLEECFLIQLKRCSSIKGLLDNYEFHTQFYGGKQDYQALRRVVDTQLEKERYNKSKADVLSSGGKTLQSLAATTPPKGKCKNWANFWEMQLWRQACLLTSSFKTAARPPAEAKEMVKRRVPTAPRNREQAPRKRMRRRKVKERGNDLVHLHLSHLQSTMRQSKPAEGPHLRAEKSPKPAAAS